MRYGFQEIQLLPANRTGLVLIVRARPWLGRSKRFYVWVFDRRRKWGMTHIMEDEQEVQDWIQLNT